MGAPKLQFPILAIMTLLEAIKCFVTHYLVPPTLHHTVPEAECLGEASTQGARLDDPVSPMLWRLRIPGLPQNSREMAPALTGPVMRMQLHYVYI